MALRSFPNRYLFSLYSKVTSLFSIRYILEIISLSDVCGYIYDPAVGDPDSGIAAGTAFEDIPEDWVCPVCGVTKSDFSVVEE